MRSITFSLLLVIATASAACSGSVAPKTGSPEPGWNPMAVQFCSARCFARPDELLALTADVGGPPDLEPLLGTVARLRRPVRLAFWGYSNVEEYVQDMSQKLGVPIELSDSSRVSLESVRPRSSALEFTFLRFPPPDRDESLPRTWAFQDGRLWYVTPEEGDALAADERTDQRANDLVRLRERVRVRWDPVQQHEKAEFDGLHRRSLVFGGSVEVENAGGDRSPLTFGLCAAVSIARKPEVELANDHAAHRTETVVRDTLLDPEGRFTVHVPAWSLQRVPGAVRRFQVVLAITDLEPAGSWRKVDHPLETSRAWLALPGPELLDPMLARIAAVSGPWPSTHDPIALVRVVNELRLLGKERAIAVLRDFWVRAGFAEFKELEPRTQHPSRPAPVEGNIDMADPDAAYLIVRLLFSPPPNPASRDMRRAGFFVNNDGYPARFGWFVCEDSEHVWPSRDSPYPLLVQDDIPFMMPRWHGNFGTGVFGSMNPIDWAEKYGNLVTRPLHPTDDPLAAAEHVANSTGLDPKNDPRAQIWRSLSDVVGLPLPESVAEPKEWSDPQHVTDDDWKRFRDAARAAGLRWDERDQRYVRTR